MWKGKMENLLLVCPLEKVCITFQGPQLPVANYSSLCLYMNVKTETDLFSETYWGFLFSDDGHCPKYHSGLPHYAIMTLNTRAIPYVPHSAH
jgi:hypothetical protein